MYVYVQVTHVKKHFYLLCEVTVQVFASVEILILMSLLEGFPRPSGCKMVHKSLIQKALEMPRHNPRHSVFYLMTSSLLSIGSSRVTACFDALFATFWFPSSEGGKHFWHRSVSKGTQLHSFKPLNVMGLPICRARKNWREIDFWVFPSLFHP